MTLNKYVKFQRGTPNDYKLLKSRSLVEDNTLYFIYEAGASQGVLYLGEVIIGNVGGDTTSTSLNLENLANVSIESVEALDIIMANADRTWKNVTFAELVDLIASQISFGTNLQLNENTFVLNENAELNLVGYVEALEGAIPTKGSNGTLTWSTNLLDDLNTSVENLESSFARLKEEIAQQIISANYLSYKVITDLNEATETNVVYLYKKADTGDSNVYYEYMLIDNKLEELGKWDVNLEDYATKDELQEISNNLNSVSGNFVNYTPVTTFNTVVGRIEDLDTYNAENPTNIVAELNNIYEHLTWQLIDINE